MICASQPTHVSVNVQDHTGALLELGAGFLENLTGRVNIILKASLLGVCQREIEYKMK